MKIIKEYSLISAVLFMLVSCASSTQPPVLPEELPEEPVVQEIEVTEELPPEIKPEESEYLRSTSEVDVSVQQFELDKKTILAKIAELDAVMAGRDYRLWLTYIDEDSITFWSRKSNLQRVAKRLPVKGMKLNSLEDYFKFVFIPSRAGKQVDEIRYETADHIKAVQVKSDSDTSVYYHFKRTEDGWKVHIPDIED